MTKTNLSVLKEVLLSFGAKEVEEYKALKDVERENTEALDSFIEKEEKKQKTLIYKATKTLPRRIAVAFAAVLITFCMLMSVSAIRTPVVNFFVKTYEEFTHFIGVPSGETVPETIETVYIPKYMEENGYIEIDKINGVLNSTIFWIYNDLMIDFSQYVIGTNTALDTEGAVYGTKYLNDIPLFFVLKNNMYTVSWTQHGYVYELGCPESLGWQEIEKIISSIEPVE